jgi:sugar-specific transcriptional regulator TrmB
MGRILLSEVTLRRVLKDFGLTDSEVEVYLFVSKKGVLSGTDVSHLIRKDKAQVFRTLKNLQAKGYVEATLEVPMRFSPVALEKVLELTIKAKKDEAARIEGDKEQLLEYWKELNKTSLDISIEKFVVIAGPHKIYPKISQMIKETKNQLSIMLTGAEIVRIIQIGLFENGREKIAPKVQFKLLTDLPSQNSRAIKVLLKEIDDTKAFFETRIPDLGLGLPHKMLIRDEDEAMFFLSSNQDKSLTEKNQTCLCTNSKVLVQAFKDVFEGLWKNSTNLHKLKEVETGAIGSKPIGIADSELARKKYEEAMNSAKKSVLMLTSPEGMMDFSNNCKLLKDWASKSVSVRIMAPIIEENFKKAQELMQFCQVRHIPNSFSRSFTLIDGKYIVQSNRPIQNHEETSSPPLIGFTNNLEYVKKTGVMLREIWKNAPTPSIVNIEYIFKETSNFSKRPDTYNSNSQTLRS